MKNFDTLSKAVLISCGFLASSCDKQSDGVMPNLEPITSSADVKPEVPFLEVKVGDVRLANEFIVGSAPGTLVDLVCTAFKQTGAGTSATWQSYDYSTGALLPAATTAYPLAGVPYTFSSTTENVFNGVNYYISRKTTWDAYGNVTLQERVNRNKEVTD